MTQTQLTAREIGERGEDIYNREIRHRVEVQHRGEFLALDIDTGDYEIAPDELDALERLKERHPRGLAYILRIGQRAAHRLGGTVTGGSR